MNEIKNDKGEWVVAVGAPGSVERVKVEWPTLIEAVTRTCETVELTDAASGDRARAVIEQSLGMIRAAGITSETETNSILEVVSERRRQTTEIIRRIQRLP